MMNLADPKLFKELSKITVTQVSLAKEVATGTKQMPPTKSAVPEPKQITAKKEATVELKEALAKKAVIATSPRAVDEVKPTLKPQRETLKDVKQFQESDADFVDLPLDQQGETNSELA